MRPLPRLWVWVALVLGAWPYFCGPVWAQAPTPPGIQAGITNTLPPLPKTPVDAFRELLAMNREEREQHLTNRPPQVRAQLEQKLREYEAMKPEEREAKLTATQLHWYLEQFILMPSSEREAQSARLTPPYREILTQRLGEFERLPPPLQKEVLAHETTRAYFLGQGALTNGGSVAPSALPPLPGPLNNFSRLPVEQREKMYASFQNYFELEGADKQKVLDTLPAAERQQVEKTLQTLERLPKEQREQGLQSIGRLAGLSDDQRRVFFSNAGRWKEMAPAEREVWLKLIGHLPPQPPANMLPPVPHPDGGLATNSPVP
jgi:hypothetical protein